MKILIVKPSSLGDVVHALPSLRLLKKHFASCEIHWWIEADLSPLLEGDPDISRLHLFHRKRWSSAWRWPELASAISHLRRESFDLVIDLQGLARSGTISWLANGQMTLGVDDPREGASGFYDRAIPRPSYETHAVDWYLAVIQTLGVNIHQSFDWIPPRVQAAQKIQEKWRPPVGRWIALQPGARWWNKRWPAAHFGELVRLVLEKNPETRFLVLGGKSDEALGDEISRAGGERVWNLTGKTSLPETIEWIRLCDLMVTNDTGPMHLAAAMGKKLISLFGPTDPRRTGPYHHLDTVVQRSLPCVPCMKDSCHNPHQLQCLREVSPRNISERVLSSLVETSE